MEERRGGGSHRGAAAGGGGSDVPDVAESSRSSEDLPAPAGTPAATPAAAPGGEVSYILWPEYYPTTDAAGSTDMLRPSSRQVFRSAHAAAAPTAQDPSAVAGMPCAAQKKLAAAVKEEMAYLVKRYSMTPAAAADVILQYLALGRPQQAHHKHGHQHLHAIKRTGGWQPGTVPVSSAHAPARGHGGTPQAAGSPRGAARTPAAATPASLRGAVDEGGPGREPGVVPGAAALDNSDAALAPGFGGGWSPQLERFGHRIGAAASCGGISDSDSYGCSDDEFTSGASSIYDDQCGDAGPALLSTRNEDGAARAEYLHRIYGMSRADADRVCMLGSELRNAAAVVAPTPGGGSEVAATVRGTAPSLAPTVAPTSTRRRFDVAGTTVPSAAVPPGAPLDDRGTAHAVESLCDKLRLLRPRQRQQQAWEAPSAPRPLRPVRSRSGSRSPNSCRGGSATAAAATASMADDALGSARSTGSKRRAADAQLVDREGAARGARSGEGDIASPERNSATDLRVAKAATDSETALAASKRVRFEAEPAARSPARGGGAAASTIGSPVAAHAASDSAAVFDAGIAAVPPREDAPVRSSNVGGGRRDDGASAGAVGSSQAADDGADEAGSDADAPTAKRRRTRQ